MLPDVVLDTTFLRRLDALGVVEVLPLLFRRIFIPSAVVVEMRRLGKGRSKLKRLIRESRGVLEVCTEGDPNVRDLLSVDLDAGEADAIAQADHFNRRHAIEVLIDEGRGHQVATDLGLRVRRTGRVLLDLKELGAIASVAEKLVILEREGMWLAPRTRRALLRAAGEEE